MKHLLIHGEYIAHNNFYLLDQQSNLQVSSQLFCKGVGVVVEVGAKQYQGHISATDSLNGTGCSGKSSDQGDKMYY